MTERTLQKLIESFSQSGDAFGRGAVALLQDVYIKLDRKITKCIELFAITSRSPILIDESDFESSHLESFINVCFV